MRVIERQCSERGRHTKCAIDYSPSMVICKIQRVDPRPVGRRLNGIVRFCGKIIGDYANDFHESVQCSPRIALSNVMRYGPEHVASTILDANRSPVPVV